MKKMIVAFMFLFIFSGASFAGEVGKELPWDFFGLVLFPGTPSSSNHSNVGGLRFGLPVSGGETKVYGIETAIFCCLTKEVRGLQTAPLFCVSSRVSGIQASPVNIADNVVGMQFGLVNISDTATFQLGLANYMKNGFLPFFPIVNFKF
jgi:hypothetical protein